MSLHLHDETKAALGEMVWRECQRAAAAHCVTEHIVHLFFDEICNGLHRFPLDVFECVTFPAGGTKSNLLAIRIAPAFYGYIAACAENWANFGNIRHDACSFEQRRLDHGIRICDENRASDSMPARRSNLRVTN